jgi:hypothetical protein
MVSHLKNALPTQAKAVFSPNFTLSLFLTKENIFYLGRFPEFQTDTLPALRIWLTR